MNAIDWKLRSAVLAISILCIPVGHAAGDRTTATVDPYDALVAKVGQEFLAISQNVDYRIEVTSPRRSVRYDDGSSRVRLKGAALEMAERYSLTELATGLWKYLDDPDQVLAASVILYAKSGETFMGSSGGGRPGNGESCRVTVRRALGQPDYWYPHKVLFDRGRVLAESKTNAAARAAYIDAMVKALADPKIRTESPLEVKNMFGCLSALKAIEATPAFCNYLFYDWKTGKDHRIGAQDNVSDGSYPGSALGAVACLARLGKGTCSAVLDRVSRATPDELSTTSGGAGMPILAIRYFALLGISEGEAVEAIHDFRRTTPNLTEARVAALDRIVEAIQGKKYRPGFLSSESPGWSVPVSTNVPPRSQP